MFSCQYFHRVDRLARLRHMKHRFDSVLYTFLFYHLTEFPRRSVSFPQKAADQYRLIFPTFHSCNLWQLFPPGPFSVPRFQFA